MRWAYRRTRRPLTHHSFLPCCRPPAHLRRSHCGTNGSAGASGRSQRTRTGAARVRGLPWDWQDHSPALSQVRRRQGASPPRPPRVRPCLACTRGSAGCALAAARARTDALGRYAPAAAPREHATPRTDGPGLEAALSTRGVASVTGSVLAAQRACLVTDRARPRSESHSRVAVRLFAAPL